jgi:isoleucyl-tRNA synthetase
VYVDFEAADKDAVYAAFGLPADETSESDETDIEEESQIPDAHDESSGRGAAAAPRPGTRPHVTPSFMIWTTTPWTLPANLAIAVHEKFRYALVVVDGNLTVMASDLVQKVTAAAKAEEVTVLAETEGKNLVGLRYRHPFIDQTSEVRHSHILENVRMSEQACNLCGIQT